MLTVQEQTLYAGYSDNSMVLLNLRNLSAKIETQLFYLGIKLLPLPSLSTT